MWGASKHRIHLGSGGQALVHLELRGQRPHPLRASFVPVVPCLFMPAATAPVDAFHTLHDLWGSRCQCLWALYKIGVQFL